MKTHQVSLNGKQYGMLEKMLCSVRARELAMNQRINGRELFYDICAPVTDGWCTFEDVLKEPDEKFNLLKFMTKVVFPEDEDHFIRQIGRKFQCEKDFEFQIDLKF